MDDEGVVLAVDVHPGRTRLIANAAVRLGLKSVVTAVADGSDSSLLREKVEQLANVSQVDLALVDAPCTGMGTLRRNPELRGRPEGTIPMMTRLQDAILDSVATLVRPGGVLVYAVCTITREEGVERIDEFLSRHPQFAGDWPQHNPGLEPFKSVHQGARTFPFLRTSCSAPRWRVATKRPMRSFTERFLSSFTRQVSQPLTLLAHRSAARRREERRTLTRRLRRRCPWRARRRRRQSKAQMM
jgi:hypothetical protein